MFWDNVAGVYDVFINVINRKTHQKLKKIVSSLIVPDDTVPECACGTGLLSAVIAQKCRQLTATDFSEKMLKKWQKIIMCFSLSRTAMMSSAQNSSLLKVRKGCCGVSEGAGYRTLLKFYKQHYSPRTIYNVFWSTDNYTMPDPVPLVNTKIEYWYGEEEKRAREKEHDIEFVCRIYPQTILKEFKGLAHAELVMMFPERFANEVKRYLEE